MTKETARIIVEQLDNYLSHTCQDYGESDHEAMMMAIEALEKESQTFEWCTDCREYDQEKHCCHRWSKVIRKAVEEIKQPCEDAISRAQAQTEIEMHACRYTLAKERDCLGKVEWDRNLIDVADAVGIIRNLPPLTPQEPKTGQWVLLDECSNSGYYCSECHKKLVKEGWSDTVKKIKYCPNCGCRMVDVPDINDGKLSEIPTGSESEAQDADSD